MSAPRWIFAGASAVRWSVLARDEVERAVELQARDYQLLKWLEKALAEGRIAPEAAHLDASVAGAARLWIERQYLSLPNAARPEREDLPALSRLFASYLTNTFDFDADPGLRLYSPDAHCFCPGCSWMALSAEAIMRSQQAILDRFGKSPFA